MFPRSSIFNMPYSRFGYSKLFGYLRIAHLALFYQIKYLYNLFLIKLVGKWCSLRYCTNSFNPMPSSNDMLHSVFTNTKPIGDFCLAKFCGFVKPLYFFGLFRSKLRCSHCFSKSSIPPSLTYAIKVIIRMSSYPKMVWIYAFWIIAFVENKFSIGNISIRYYPRNPVSNCVFSRNHQKPISEFVLCSCPFPTFISSGFFDFVPKSLNRTLSCMGPIHYFTLGHTPTVNYSLGDAT